MSMPLDEVMLITMLGDVWNVFQEIVNSNDIQTPTGLSNSWHPDDVRDFRYHLHAMQNIVASRVGYRELNEIKGVK